MAKNKVKPGKLDGVGISWVHDPSNFKPIEDAVINIEENPRKVDAPDGLDYLGTPGRTVYQRWKNILEKKQIWDDDCIEIVGMAAMQYEIYVKASQELLKPSMFGDDELDHSFVVQHKNGSTGMSPWVTIQNTAFNSVNKFIIKFGLTPVDRTKASKREDDEEDEI